MLVNTVLLCCSILYTAWTEVKEWKYTPRSHSCRVHLIQTVTAVINEQSDDARTNTSLQKYIYYLTQLQEVNLTMTV